MNIYVYLGSKETAVPVSLDNKYICIFMIEGDRCSSIIFMCFLGMLRSDSVCATSKVIVNLRGSQKTPELSRTIQRTVKKGST